MKNILKLSLKTILFLFISILNNDSHCEAKNSPAMNDAKADKVIARLNGKDIYLLDLDYDFQARYTLELHKLEAKLYREKKYKLNQTIDEILLGQKGIPDETPEVSITRVDTERLQMIENTTGDKEKLYYEFLEGINKSYPGFSEMSEDEQLELLRKMLGINKGSESSLKEEIKNKIAEMGEMLNLSNKRNELLEKLRSEASIEIMLESPELIQLQVTTDDDPYLGGKDANITIIEFADYQCPFCSKITPILKDLLAKNKDKIKIVFRDFPLPSHKNAQKAAEASECADEQGKFWEYNAILFNNQQSLDIESLKKYAMHIGLDLQSFSQCLESNIAEAEVMKDVADARIAGLMSTPSILVNGYYISGIPTVSYLEEVIADIENHNIPRLNEAVGKG